jgi:hypothetical protein
VILIAARREACTSGSPLSVRCSQQMSTPSIRSGLSSVGRGEIRLKNRAVIAFPGRTRQTLRGGSVDVYLADEASAGDE